MGGFLRLGPFGSAWRAIGAAGRAMARVFSGSLAALGILCVSVSMTGCYTYVRRPIEEAAPNARVSAEINDAGRVALGEQIGSEVERIDGEIVQRSDSALQLMISEVHYLNGTANKWEGQEVTLRPTYIKSLSQRTYSKQQSVLAAIVIGGLIALAIAAAAFTGVFGGDPNRDPPGGGGPQPDS